MLNRVWQTRPPIPVRLTSKPKSNSHTARFVTDEKKGPRPSQEAYERILADYGAEARSSAESVDHLVRLGYSKGQARSAVYRFRQRRGLTSTKAEGK